MWHPRFMLFVGSGFSIGQGGPSWTELRDLAVSEIVGHLSKAGREEMWGKLTDVVVKTSGREGYASPEVRKKPEFAMWVIGEAFGGPQQLASFLGRYLLPRASLLHTITVQKVLRDAGIILTTEFDGLFVDAIKQLRGEKAWRLTEVRSEADRTVQPSLALATGERPRPVRIHGCCESEILAELHGNVHHPDTLVCSLDQVDSWRNERAADEVVRLLAECETAIFWGCGGKDHDIAELLRHVDGKRSPFRRTLVVDKAEAKERLLGDLRAIPLLGNVVPIVCDGLSGGETWQVIDGFMV